MSVNYTETVRKRPPVFYNFQIQVLELVMCFYLLKWLLSGYVLPKFPCKLYKDNKNYIISISNCRGTFYMCDHTGPTWFPSSPEGGTGCSVQLPGVARLENRAQRWAGSSENWTRNLQCRHTNRWVSGREPHGHFYRLPICVECCVYRSVDFCLKLCLWLNWACQIPSLRVKLMARLILGVSDTGFMLKAIYFQLNVYYIWDVKCSVRCEQFI